jgi:hypothetical protein
MLHQLLVFYIEMQKNKTHPQKKLRMGKIAMKKKNYH